MGGRVCRGSVSYIKYASTWDKLLWQYKYLLLSEYVNLLSRILFSPRGQSLELGTHRSRGYVLAFPSLLKCSLGEAYLSYGPSSWLKPQSWSYIHVKHPFLLSSTKPILSWGKTGKKTSEGFEWLSFLKVVHRALSMICMVCLTPTMLHSSQFTNEKLREVN